MPHTKLPDAVVFQREKNKITRILDMMDQKIPHLRGHKHIRLVQQKQELLYRLESLRKAYGRE